MKFVPCVLTGDEQREAYFQRQVEKIRRMLRCGEYDKGPHSGIWEDAQWLVDELSNLDIVYKKQKAEIETLKSTIETLKAEIGALRPAP